VTYCVVNIWNSLPVDTDFSSLTRFIQKINSLDLSFAVPSVSSFPAKFLCLDFMLVLIFYPSA